MPKHFEIDEEVSITIGGQSFRGKVLEYYRSTTIGFTRAENTALDKPDTVTVIPPDPLESTIGRTSYKVGVSYQTPEGRSSRALFSSESGEFKHVHKIIDVEPSN